MKTACRFHHIHEIEIAACPEALQDFQAILHGIAALQQIVAGDADAQQEIVAHGRPRLGQHLQREAHAVLEAAAIAIGAMVGRRAEELVVDMAGEDEFAAVEIAFLAAPGRLGSIVVHPLDIKILHRLGEGVVREARARGGEGGEPVLRIPAGAPAHMGELAHELGAMAMDPRGELLEKGNDGIIADGDLVPQGGRRIDGNGGGAAEHGEPDAALGLLLVIELIALLRLAVLAIGRRMARPHDPVADRQMLDRQGRQQSVGTREGLFNRRSWPVIAGPARITASASAAKAGASCSCPMPGCRRRRGAAPRTWPGTVSPTRRAAV